MSRSLTSVARELQSASNRRALAQRNHSRDTILAGIFPDVAKGRRARARLVSGAEALKAMDGDVERLRAELADKLAQLDNESRIH